MSDKIGGGTVRMAFERATVRLQIVDIQPQRAISPAVKKASKYLQMQASIRELGIIEPPVVWPLGTQKGRYLLLDGHLRIEALKDAGLSEVACLVSTDDEAFTYNRHFSRMATIQEHRMMSKVIELGVPVERMARAFDVDPKSLQKKMHLLDGICPEVVELLKDKQVPMNAFQILKQMRPFRQIEAAESMVAFNCFRASYASSLLAATPQADLIDSKRPKRVKGLTASQTALMERESANLTREFKMIEESHGADLLDFVVAGGFLGKLLHNDRIVRYLEQHHTDILPEFRSLWEMGRDAGLMNGASSPQG